MLREHLSQEHDAASRRFAEIDRHVAWIHQSVLARQPTRVLDLGCGPGLYTSRLARLGHTCTGIDFAPASTAYATEEARTGRLPCWYIQGDIRTVDCGTGYGIVMLTFWGVSLSAANDAGKIRRLRQVFAAVDATG